MNDHERFLLLAAQRIGEPLTREEDAELEAHLDACPTCRAIVAGMRRDDIRLRAALAPVAVAPRVRDAVLAEAADRHRFRAAARLILGIAAALGVAAIGMPLIAGGLREASPTTPPTPSVASVLSPSPSASTSTTPSPVPSVSNAPSPSETATPPPSPGLAGSVNGSFTYSEFQPRHGSISARFVDGKPEGAWTRRATTGAGDVWSGTITCLVIDGDEAWMAGPVTQNPVGRTDEAIFILVRDRGPEGNGDRAMMDPSDQGQTLALFEGWCRDKFRPGAPYVVIDGDVRVDDR